MNPILGAAVIVVIAALLQSAGPGSGVAAHPVRDALSQFLRDQPLLKGEPAPQPLRRSRPTVAATDKYAPFKEECQNGEYCNGGESCCNGGQFCCSNGTSCCQDSCCSNSTNYQAETCCPDPKNGGVCCLEETTFCCAPDEANDTPSRCCPRWYVCCLVGRYGCCNPDDMMPMEQHQHLLRQQRMPAAAVRGSRRHHHDQNHQLPRSAAPLLDTARVIFEESNIWTDETYLYGNDLNLVNGSIGDRTQLTPGIFHTEQEMTRVFAYSPSRDEFYLVQANFTDPALDYPVTLYRFKSTTGEVSKQGVTGGVDGLVTGFYWSREQGVLLLATEWTAAPSSATVLGYKFWTLEVDSAAATLVSTLKNPESGDLYGGWFHEASADLKFVYRAGYENVVDSTNFGLGIIDISHSSALHLPWVPVQNPAGNFGRLRSIHRIRGASADSGGSAFNVTFISLAQAENVTSMMDLGVFEWQPVPTGPIAIRQLAQLGNAHLTEFFGPIAQATDETRTRYAALVVQLSALGSTYNSWALATVNVETGTSNLLPLAPTVLSSIDSLSGFGIPDGA
jgi:hypothetical protein